MTLRRSLIALAVLVVLVAIGGWWRALRVTGQLLEVDAPAAIREKSGNVYQVAVGRVRFNPLDRRVTVDTIQVTTNDAVNAARPHPRTGLRLLFRNCALRGVHVFTLLLRRGLVANRFGCAAVTAAIDVPRGTPDSLPPKAAERTFFELQKGLRLPTAAPQVRVALIDFPQIALDYRLRNAGGDTRLRLEHLSWRMTAFLIDPSDSTAARRPLFSDTVEIAARDFTGEMSGGTKVTVKSLRLSLGDSTLRINGAVFAPSPSEVSVARIEARGLDLGEFLLRQGVRARQVQLDSLRVDITADERPHPLTKGTHQTPQAWIREIERGVRVDSVVIRDGEVSYREINPRHAVAGVMTWSRVNAVATNVRHVPGRRSERDTLTLTATSWLQNAGKFDVQFVMPLDARTFTMTYRGQLGPMPAAGFNAYLDGAEPWRLDKGQVERIAFDVRVANGVARGTIVPLYKDLALKVTGTGSGGILGTGGVVGDAARGVATLVGNETQIRSDNPDDGAKSPRTGTVNHAFTPDETLPAFLWLSLRGGLVAVVKK